MSLSAEQYRALSVVPAAHWFCPPCEAPAIKKVRIEKEVEERSVESSKLKRVSALKADMANKADDVFINEIDIRARQNENKMEGLSKIVG